MPTKAARGQSSKPLSSTRGRRRCHPHTAGVVKSAAGSSNHSNPAVANRPRCPKRAAEAASCVYVDSDIMCLWQKRKQSSKRRAISPHLCPESPESTSESGGGRRDELRRKKTERNRHRPRYDGQMHGLSTTKGAKTKRGYKPPAHPGPSTGRSCSK